MTPSAWSALATTLEGGLSHRFVGRVTRPDPWSIGLELERGVTLGFCWHPGRPAAGLCAFPWPRRNPSDLLRALLHGVRLGEVAALEGEPVLRFALMGSRAGCLVFEALGRSTNLLLLGEDGGVLWAGRTLKGPFRSGRTGEIWAPPPARRVPGEIPLPPPDPESELWGGLLERARAVVLRDLARRERALRRRMDAVCADREEGGDPETLSAMGQGLLASGNLGRRGEVEREVSDYSLDPPATVRVPLDPALSVRENADRLFKKARKAKVRENEAQRLLGEIEGLLQDLAQERERTHTCGDLDAFFSEGGGPAPRVRQPRRELPPGISRVSLPEGFAGYAGKSAPGNHAVSFRLGKGGDFWFHVADYPGAHVVVKNPARLVSLPPAVELAAALYAAAHSQAPPGNRVGVTAARCKDLRPAPGRPGQVFLSGGRTLFVDLDPR